MTVSFIPIWIVDVGGAVLMIFLSVGCVRYAHRLKLRDSQNIIWTYLLWISLSMAVFAVSRSVGHIVKQVLILADHNQTWEIIRPYSGAINSVTFMVVAALTLFFERTWTIYQSIVRDRQALQYAHQALLDLNQSLEQRVVHRTAALAHSELRYRRIFEASKDPIITTSPEGAVLDLNPVGYQLLGLAAGQPLSGISIEDYLMQPEQWDVLLRQVREKGAITSLELDFKTVTGERTRTLISAGAAAGEADYENTIHFVVKDIEQQYALREQMAKADKLASIGELSAGIAHEINNPLGIILGYTQLLLRQEKESNQRRDDLKTVEKHVRHCKSIVEDLLNFARTSAPKKELLDIHAILDEVVDFIQQHAKPDLISIQRDYDRQIGLLQMDEKKIKQVFINLVMNAIYAIETRGRITIETRLDNEKRAALIHVQDTGSGIAESDMVRIFDPFFTTKPTGKGTGLGLSVSYGIIHTHGGEITVDSSPGQGSTFTIELPLPNDSKEG